MVYGSRPKTRTVYVFEREEVEIPLLSFFFSLSLFLLFREDPSDDEDSSEEISSSLYKEVDDQNEQRTETGFSER